MFFAAFPPEINSALMYSGAGASPLLGSAAAWESLSASLTDTVSSFTSVVGTLADSWTGQAAVAMTASATRYLSWLTQAATQAALTSSQASAAAAAYEEAFALTVPPPVIAANRTLLSVLVATNFLGINTPAIMATEAHYMEMWAQDVTAMTGYQAQSAAATSALPQWTPPAPTTTGVQASGISSAASNTQGILGGIFAPGSGNDTTGLSGLLNLISGGSNSAFGNLINANFLNDFASSGLVNPGETLAPIIALAALVPAFQQMGQMSTPDATNPTVGNGAAHGNGAGNVPYYGGMGQPSASVGQANTVGGRLSVPRGWGDSVFSNTVNSVGTQPAGRPLGGSGMPLGMMPMTAGGERPRF